MDMTFARWESDSPRFKRLFYSLMHIGIFCHTKSYKRYEWDEYLFD